MGEILSRALIYALVPMGAICLSAIVATFRPFGRTFRSYVQHFAAGALFSVISIELLPDMLRERKPVPVILGFALGLSVMLGIRSSEMRFARAEDKLERLTSLLVSVGGYLLVVGLAIGIGLGTGKVERKLLTLALTIEAFFLGVSSAAALIRAGVGRRGVVLTLVSFSPLILIGAAAGAFLLPRLFPVVTDVMLAFGFAALLFLATEELLLEARVEPETPLATATFFSGFLLFLVLSLYG